MNKIFKTKFNFATNNWVAVSELASNKGKTGAVVNDSVSMKSVVKKYFSLTGISVALWAGFSAPQGIAAINLGGTNTVIGGDGKHYVVILTPDEKGNGTNNNTANANNNNINPPRHSPYDYHTPNNRNQLGNN